MKVSVFNRQEDLAIATKSVKPIIKEVLFLEKRSADEVAVYFVTSMEISRLHRDFFQDPTTTDCISFPLDQDDHVGYRILGDIYICPKTALDYIAKSKKKWKMQDLYIETTLYLVHGLLHLLGYDDIDATDRKKMKQIEKKIMEHLIKSQILLFGI